jgi:acetylornithine/N-succinyldiaminopimelate aminotransferase
VQAALAEDGLLVIAAGDNVLRFAPPLIIREAECAEALTMLRRTAQRLRAA